MQRRLTSLALLHEKTYHSKDFKNINLKDFILDHDNQLKAFTGMKNNVEFESDVDENLNLTIEVITSLLLIIDGHPDSSASSTSSAQYFKNLINYLHF